MNELKLAVHQQTTVRQSNRFANRGYARQKHTDSPIIMKEMQDKQNEKYIIKGGLFNSRIRTESIVIDIC